VATLIAAQPITQVAATDLVRDLDLTDDEVQYLLDLAGKVKRAPAKFARALAGKYICLLFEKPSLRTRLTFDLAIKQLGGDSVVSEGPVDGREPLKDVARNLERWVQGIVARTFADHHRGTGELVVGSGHQRAERSLSSLPGIGGRIHAA